MFKNYLKTAFRNLWNNKSYSIINIVGLTIGTLSCLYILLYVQDQYSYDSHHNDAQNIYRITTSLSLKGDKHKNATASPPIAPALKRDFAEVKEFTRVVSAIGIKQHLLRYKEKSFYETDMVYVDSTFFSVFNYHVHLISGIATLGWFLYCLIHAILVLNVFRFQVGLDDESRAK